MVSGEKLAERIEIPFGLWAQVGSMNHTLDGGSDHPMQKGNFLGDLCKTVHPMLLDHCPVCPAVCFSVVCLQRWCIVAKQLDGSR